IRDYADKNNCDIYQYELEVQFRCSGSEGFINWVNNTLGIQRTANVIWNAKEEEFDFKIFDSPFELEEAIKSKIAEGNTGRLTAGFCWKWSDPDNNGNLEDDVVIGEFRRPWNAKPDSKRLAKGIPKAYYWANDPDGIKQIGCIYTAQGFEFDYVGVIFGNDLVYDFERQEWIAVPENFQDKVVKRSGENLVNLMKNVYRVLLTRGIKGCYVYFMDKSTRDFIKSRIENFD
ncbi:MAG: DNA/RNA helicase domain-containing protein, partial [Candidatus Hydromicrobium sp.]